MIRHIFVLGPSGAGKSSVAAHASKCRGYLHIELDGTSTTPPRSRPSLFSRIRTRLEGGLSIRGAEFEAVSFGSLSRQWRSFIGGNASPLANELRRRSDQASAVACVVSFPSGVVLSAEQIRAAEEADISVRILYGSREDCIRAFLMREAATGRRLEREHWLSYNLPAHQAFGSEQFDRHRVPTFDRDGNRVSLDRLVEMIAAPSDQQPNPDDQ